MCRWAGKHKQLSESLGVTGITIRNDLEQLEKKNILIRARGGEIKITPAHSNEGYPLSDKQKKNSLKKQQSGERESS